MLRDGYVLVEEEDLEVLQMPGESIIVAYFSSEGRFEICEDYFSLASYACINKCAGYI